MAYFYSLRGWLEIDPEDIQKLTERITTLREDYSSNPKLALYMQGWCWNQSTFNWTGYVFYGADVTLEGLDLLEAVLADLTGLALGISGYFHAQGEDGERNIVYKMIDDILQKENGSILLNLS